MIKEKSATIKSRAVFSKDEKHRYLLERIWNDKKKKATVIMLNPSFADELKTDQTICKVMNFLIEKDFGTLRVVNLYAFISSEPSHPKKNHDVVGELNNQYILDAINDTDVIIIAWGVEKKEYIKRIAEVKEILSKSGKKIKTFIVNDRVGGHPSRGNISDMIDYSLE
ncbi:MAG: DUF1643 domain-containing protein [Treponema sp.]|jgi:hypothetical protein|nr:DUF1643 domain-containing protein [Treponema sp.]